MAHFLSFALHGLGPHSAILLQISGSVGKSGCGKAGGAPLKMIYGILALTYLVSY